MGQATSRTKPSMVAREVLARSPAIEVLCGEWDAARTETMQVPASKQTRIGSSVLLFRWALHTLQPASSRCRICNPAWSPGETSRFHLSTAFREFPVSHPLPSFRSACGIAKAIPWYETSITNVDTKGRFFSNSLEWMAKIVRCWCSLKIAVPRRLKPDSKQGSYRSGKPLRQPKSCPFKAVSKLQHCESGSHLYSFRRNAYSAGA